MDAKKNPRVGDKPDTVQNEAKNEQKSEMVEEQRQYPPFKIVLPAMAAIWLAFFLVALVRLNPNSLEEYTNMLQGPNHHRHCNTHYHERLQQLWGRRVV